MIDQVVDRQGNRQNLPGGAPANVAVALARLGLSVAFVGAIGADANGHDLVQVLQYHRVNCEGVQTCNAPTRIVEVHCTPAGDRHFHGFVGGSTTAFADAQLAAEHLRPAQWAAAQVLVTGTLGLAYPVSHSAIKQAAALVKAQGGKVVVDVNWRPTFWPDARLAEAVLLPWLQQADLIKVAVDEALALWQTNDVAQLQAQLSCEQILLTDGDRGCQYAFGDCRGQVPAFSVPAVETTGAGDAFLAGMVYQCQLHDWQLATADRIERAVQFASAMGALTTLQPGAIAALPAVHELLNFLSAQTGEVWTMGRV